MKRILLSVLLLGAFSSCGLFEKKEEDDTLKWFTLAWLLQPRYNCSDNSGMVICIPPGFVQNR